MGRFLMSVWALTFLLGCATARGPLLLAPPIPGDSTAIYVYRYTPEEAGWDAGERVFLDEEEVALLKSGSSVADNPPCSFVRLDVEPGVKRLRTKEKRYRLYATYNPSRQVLELEVERGTVYYVGVWVKVVDEEECSDPFFDDEDEECSPAYDKRMKYTTDYYESGIEGCHEVPRLRSNERSRQ